MKRPPATVKVELPEGMARVALDRTDDILKACVCGRRT